MKKLMLALKTYKYLLLLALTWFLLFVMILQGWSLHNRIQRDIHRLLASQAQSFYYDEQNHLHMDQNSISEVLKSLKPFYSGYEGNLLTVKIRELNKMLSTGICPDDCDQNLIICVHEKTLELISRYYKVLDGWSNAVVIMAALLLGFCVFGSYLYYRIKNR